MKNYYDLLGLQFGAGAAEIKRAYRALAVRYHPDKNPAPEAESLFKEINEAYDVLGDPEKKRKYDLRWQMPFEDYNAVKDKNEDPRYRRRRPASYRPVQTEHSITALIRAYHGRVMRINYLAIFVLTLVAVDYFLPTHQNTERIALISRFRYYSAIETFAKSKVTMTRNVAELFDMGGQIEIYRTPIFSTARAVSNGHLIFPLYNQGIYGPIGLIPVALLVTSCAALILRKDIVSSFNFSVVTATLLFITTCLICVL